MQNKLARAVSLFDGIGSLWQALKELGIGVDEAYSYEIDKYAIQVCQANHREVTHMGSVIGADFTQHKGADLVAGGFPCTDLSIAKKDRKGLQGTHSSLFWELVRAIKEIQPRYFLVENNASMPKADRDIITKTLGVEPILINSALVSAQSRKRLYWTSIPNIQQPKDKNILLADIIENGMIDREKSLCVTASALGNTDDYLKRKTRQGVWASSRLFHFGKGNQDERVYSVNAKSITLSTTNNAYITHPVCANSKSGRGGSPTAQPSVQDRIYSVNGKMSALTTSYCPSIAVGVAFRTYPRKKTTGVERVKQPELRADGKSNCLTSTTTDSMVLHSTSCPAKHVTVVNGLAFYKGRQYKLNLPDGSYIIRKLTPVECERLQTLPDNYTAGISNTQRYKCLGNGWTVEVIKHILSNIQ